MGFPQENSFILLLYSVCVGAMLGVLWDFFRILRIAAYGKRKSGTPPPIKLPASPNEVKKAIDFCHTQKKLSISGIQIFFCDFLFCIISALSIILLLFQLNDGEIRGFALSGATLGFIAYYFTVGRLTVIFSDIIIRFIKKTVFLILKFTVFPVLNLLKQVYLFVFNKIYAIIRKRKTRIFINKTLKKAEHGFGILKN